MSKSEPTPESSREGHIPSEPTVLSEEDRAAAPDTRSILNALEETQVVLPRVSLTGNWENAPEQGADQELPVTMPVESRYELFSEIARGGMGAVIRGRDNDLGRELAIKVMLETHSDRPEILQRFVEEAQISGQLQHPGIVPVYELGQFADRRPFFAMKLVRGETLASLLDERKATNDDRGRFVGIFEQICQTLGYAHNQGVIHRDLKPANVMVGAFGEVQVMDWGLAKVLTPRQRPDDREQNDERESAGSVHTVRTARADTSLGDGTQTHAGEVMGTLAYMAPEQARGDVDQLDERADVFGLGAILCQILTGQPPYVAGDFRTLHQMASEGKLNDCHMKLAECAADAELVALAKSCLAADRDDRPRDAGEVAARVTGYLESVENRLRQAELDRIEARTRAAEERKRRQVTLALAASIFVALSLVGGGSYFIQKQRTELAQQRANTIEEKAARESQQTLERQRLAGQVTAALNEASDLQLGGASNEADTLLQLTRAAEAARRAESLLETGEVDKPLRQRVTQLVSSLNLQLRDRRLATALDVAWRWDSEKLASSDETAISAGGTIAMFPIPDAAPLYASALSDWGIVPLETAVAEAADRIRACDAALLGQIVVCLERWAGLLEDAEQREWISEVVERSDADPWRAELRNKLADGDLQTLSEFATSGDLASQPTIVWVRLAVALREAGDTEPAASLLQRLLQQDAGDYWVNYTLAQTLAQGDKMETALRYATAAIAVRPHNALAHLGICFIVKPGVGSYSANDPLIALAAEHSLRATQLDDTSAIARFYLGNVYQDLGKYEEAVVAYRAAIAIDAEKAAFFTNLANALQAQKKFSEALEARRTAIKIAPDFASFHTNLGINLGMSGDPDGAVEACRKAIELDPQLFAAQYYLGKMLAQLGKLDEGISHLRIAVELDPNDRPARNALGIALAQSGKLDEASVQWRRALEISPGDRFATNNLGTALYSQGKYKEAEETFRTAIELDPTSQSYSNLGLVLQGQGRVDEALEALRRAIEIDPQNAATLANAGHLLTAQGEFTESLEMLKRAHQIGATMRFWPHPSAKWVKNAERLVELDGKLAEVRSGKIELSGPKEQLEYAELCVKKKLYHASVNFYINAFDDSDLAQDLNGGQRYRAIRSAALAAAGQDASVELDADQKTKLRQQALEWLVADLELWKRVANREVAQASMNHWLKDPALENIRSAEGMATFPDDEQQRLQEFWQDVEQFNKLPATM